MIKLRSMARSERDAFFVPKSVQKSIPIKRIYKDGIWQVSKKFSKTWRFTDINYRVAGHDDQLAMFMDYCGLLNALDSEATAKITINNRRLNRKEFAQSMLMKADGGRLDKYRNEYNDMLTEKAEEAHNIIQEKYITMSVERKNIDEARSFFARVHTDLSSYLNKLGSKAVELDNRERLRIFHDFYRMGEEQYFRFDLRETMKKGHDFCDYICPDDLQFKNDYFEMGGKFGRVIFLKEYASFLKDSMISELTDFSRNLMLSVDILPIPTDEAVKDMQNRILAIETDVTRWQRKQNMQNNFSAVLPYDMELMRKEAKEFLDDLTSRDQRMMFVVVTMVHIADSKEELDNDTETLLSIGRKNLCQFAVMKYQQEDALNTVLPFGLRRINALRTLTTESTAVLMPFTVQEVMERGGVYYGQNAISRNMIVCDRGNLLNANGMCCGVSGSGKSFSIKAEIASRYLSTDDDILIIDIEREFSGLVRELGGEVITISAGSPHHINALDMSKDYNDGGNPVLLKSEFVLSLCEQLVGSGRLGAKEKSLIDRCTANVYKQFLRPMGGKKEPPTLQDFHAELLKQSEPEAKDIALSIELFTQGSLNTFAHQTNVSLNSRLISFDIFSLGKQLVTTGMLVVLDAIWNRITRNRQEGRRTWVYVDEGHLVLANEYSAQYLHTLWRRVRKYNAAMTLATQNVSDMLQSHTARVMLANSEFLLLLNQAATEREELARLLNISETQLSYITNSPSGSGLIKIGGALVPFVNKFPHNSLYQLMSTKPNESI